MDTFVQSCGYICLYSTVIVISCRELDEVQPGSDASAFSHGEMFAGEPPAKSEHAIPLPAFGNLDHMAPWSESK